MATYYIKNSGSNANTGLSDGQAWQTLSKIASSTFSAGDIICLNKGDLWREQFLLPSSGTVGSYITITNYGTGDLPKIYGSTLVSAWTNVSGNIWKSTANAVNPQAGDWPSNVLFVSSGDVVHWGVDEYASITGTGGLTKEYDWWWNSSDSKLYIYSPTDPNTRYVGVEVQTRDYCIGLNGKQYITIDGIETRYFKLAGIYEKDPITELHGLTVKNCKSSYSCLRGGSVGYGFHIFHSDMLVQNNVCHDNGRRNISCSASSNSGITFSNIILEGNELYNGYHTTGIDLGHSGNCNYNNVIVRNNYIYHTLDHDVKSIFGDPSEGIFVKNVSGQHTNIAIYNNLIINTIGSAIQLEEIKDCDVYNNTIWGVHPGTVNVSWTDGLLLLSNTQSGGGTVLARNNIIYNNQPVTANVRYCIYRASDDNCSTVDYNLYFDTISSRNIISWGGGYTMAQWASYKANTGQDAHSPTPADPLLVSPLTFDYHLQSGSPARNRGTTTLTSTDYGGIAWSFPSAVGAYEYLGAIVIPTVTTTVITNINETTATGGGNVTSSGGGTISSRGVCWNTTIDPTIANSKTIDGSGTGVFVSSLTSLVVGTHYYVRAYATNEIGTAYGANVEFDTIGGSFGVIITKAKIHNWLIL